MPIVSVENCNQYGVPMDMVNRLENTVEEMLGNYTISIELLEPIDTMPWFYVITGFHALIALLMIISGVIFSQMQTTQDALSKQSLTYFNNPHE